MTITGRVAAWHRQRRVLLRVSRAAWRLEQAERERSWALASARAEGISIRTLAAAAVDPQTFQGGGLAAEGLGQPDLGVAPFPDLGA